MSLRKQLLALGALTLLLPWAGFRFLKETEASLRGAQVDPLVAVAATIASQVAGSDDLVPRPVPVAGLGPPLYAHGLAGPPPRLDGSRDDWQYLRQPRAADAAARATVLADGSRIWLGVQEPFLFLYIEVDDDELVLQPAPGQAPHGDRVVLIYGNRAEWFEALLLTSPRAGTDTDLNPEAGNFRAQWSPGGERFESTGDLDSNVFGNLRRRRGGGYSIEARMPLATIEGALGIGIIDTDDGGRTAALAAATWTDTIVPNRLVREWPALNGFLRQFADLASRFRVLDANGLVLADSGPLELSVAVVNEDPSLIQRFLRLTVERNDPPYANLERRPGQIGDPAVLAAIDGGPATAWYAIGGETSAIIAAAAPIRGADRRFGAVLLEQESNAVLTIRNEATMRLMGTTVLASLVAAFALLAYASLLSLRIGRLARAAESALGPRGEIRHKVPGTRARDEIGVLARSFEDLLGRLRDYTDYLQSLKSKLTHELRTPLAIVATSLDNLEQESRSESGQAYLERLRHGTSRLESILQAMTAATRVEQAITQTELERFDLKAVVSACVSAYTDVYAGRRFEANLPEAPVFVEGSAELIEQLLDKLIDNAVSFAAAGTAIEVVLESDRDEASLAVINKGPLLPAAMRHQLFDSLVSVRAAGGDRPHLGLGLYIVTLIAEFHRGRVEADNLVDGSGVRIGVVLPCAERPGD